MSSFTGQLSQLSVADLFLFLERSNRTGTLILQRAAQDERERAQFVFEEGQLVGARTLATSPLGDLLLREHEITPRELAEAIAVQRGEASPATPLGEILVRAGVLTRRALEAALAEQIRAGVAGVREWAEGEFEFFEEEVRSRAGHAVHGGEDLPLSGLPPLRVLAEAEKVFTERSVRDTHPAVAPPSEDGSAITAKETVERFQYLRAQASSDGGSLALLRLIAERFERGLLLEPADGRLAVLGAFGGGREGLLAQSASRGLRVDLAEAGGLAPWATRGPWRGLEARRQLPPRLAVLLPEVIPAEAILLPLIGVAADGGSVVVAVVFAESDDEMPAEEVEALNAASRDLATALQGTRAAT